jgi:hypothetical protein
MSQTGEIFEQGTPLVIKEKGRHFYTAHPAYENAYGFIVIRTHKLLTRIPIWLVEKIEVVSV